VLLNELVRLNEQAARLETTLEAQGIGTTDVEDTMNKVLAAGGPPLTGVGADTALIACTKETVTDRLINLLNSNVAGGVDWAADA